MTGTLAICVPSRGMVSTRSFQMLTASILEASGVWNGTLGGSGTFILCESRAHCAQARNRIVEMALEHGAEWTLWFDDDAIPPLGTAQRLFGHGVDIVAPVHRLRHPPHYECPAKRIAPDGQKSFVALDGGLVEADYMGMHCVLIRAEVFRRCIEFLTASPIRFPDGSTSAAPFQNWPGMGEDVFFFQIARKAGFKVWLDTDWEVDHALDSSVGEMRRK